jgi:hypothetical protein
MKSKYFNTKKYICCVCGTARRSILLKIKETIEMTTSLRRKTTQITFENYYLTGKQIKNLAAETDSHDSFASMMAPYIISFVASHKQPFTGVNLGREEKL